MRVIAGSARGTPLVSPRSDARPTMDQVKSAIFSSLGDKVIGARVLDCADLPRALAEKGIFVLEKCPVQLPERLRSAGILPKLAQWHVLRQKTYGGTEVIFLTRS